MYQLKTTLPDQINNIEDAKKYLSELYNNGESYHPDDDASDILFEGDECVDSYTAIKMNALMDRIYFLAKNTDFDPCGYILSLNPDYKTED